MPKTWSNNKVTGIIPVTVDTKHRRRAAAPFVILMAALTILFSTIMVWTLFKTWHHPQHELAQPVAEPKDD